MEITRQKSHSAQERSCAIRDAPSFRSYSTLEELAHLKKWFPFGGYGTSGKSTQNLIDSSDGGQFLALPVQTLGHSLILTSCYSSVQLPDKVLSDTSFIFPTAPFGSCVITLTKTILGSVLLGLPYVCHVNGIGLFALLLMTFATFSSSTMYLLVRATDIAHRSGHAPFDIDFGYLGQLAYGMAGLRAVQVVVGMDLWGTLVAYMVVVADIVQPAVALWTEGTSVACLGSRVPVICASALLISPMCMTSGLHALGSVSRIGLMALSAFAVFLIFRCVTTDFEQHLNNAAAFQLSLGTVQTLPVVVFIYNAHFNIISVYNTLENRSVERMRTIIFLACGISTLAALAIGVAGNILYGAAVEGNVLQNMALNDMPALVVRALFGLAIALTYPVVAFELRRMLEVFLTGRRARKPLRVTLALGLVITSTITAIVVPNVTVAFAMVGGTTTTTMAFVLPPAFFLKLYYSSKTKEERYWRDTLPIWAILFLGMTAVPILTYLTLQRAGL